MENIQIFHNPRCSKSREALALLRENGVEPEIREYLKQPPSEAELAALLHKLNIPAIDLVRKGEALFKEQFKGKDLSNEEWIRALAENPVLIERPIVISGKKAVIGRPPSLVLTLND